MWSSRNRSDGDGVPNCIDGCPDNSPKVTLEFVVVLLLTLIQTMMALQIVMTDVRIIHLRLLLEPFLVASIADTDTDGDGTANCVDSCPSDPAKISAGACGCSRY